MNAWVLLVTSKAPDWRDPYLAWPSDPPTLGEPHPGFFYPDPLGFWAEVRRWIVELTRARESGWGPAEALSVAAAVHVGDDPARVRWARSLTRPAVVLHLDEASAADAIASVTTRERYSVPDPHRPGQYYEGWWGRERDGTIVGKAPQHPAARRLYRDDDLTAFLRALPRCA